MTPLIILAVGLAIGVEPRKLAILATVQLMPLLALAGIAVVVAMSRRRADPGAALFCDGVASELRAGGSIRQSIAASARTLGASDLASAASERSLEEVADLAGTAFPGIRRELETIITRAATTGGASADLFDEVGSLALAQTEILREVRVASAPARAALTLFVILPSGFFLSRLMSGGAGDLTAASGQRVMASVGLTVFLIGVVISWVLVWRAR